MLSEECRGGGGCNPIVNPHTVEELERRAVVQKNDLVLHEAVIKSEVETVRRILREPVEINSRNNVSGAQLLWWWGKWAVQTIIFLTEMIGLKLFI